jgi:hypothetical protein
LLFKYIYVRTTKNQLYSKQTWLRDINP